MNKRYQIVKREPGGGLDRKWEFVAHGARYEREEADQVKEVLTSRGCNVRLLPA